MANCRIYSTAVRGPSVINIYRAGAQKVVCAAAEQNYSLDSSRKLRVIQRCEATPTELLN